MLSIALQFKDIFSQLEPWEKFFITPFGDPYCGIYIAYKKKKQICTKKGHKRPKKEGKN
jgi:hypothetical protein